MADASAVERYGIDGQLVHNTAAYASPSWTRIKNVDELSVAISVEEDEATPHTTHWKLTAGKLNVVEISFKLRAYAGDADLALFWDAFWNRTLLDLAVFEAAPGDSLPRGMHAMWRVVAQPRSQNSGEVINYSITLKPAYHASNLPEILNAA